MLQQHVSTLDWRIDSGDLLTMLTAFIIQEPCVGEVTSLFCRCLTEKRHMYEFVHEISCKRTYAKSKLQKKNNHERASNNNV